MFACFVLFFNFTWLFAYLFFPYSPDYNVEFFRKFMLVMNALDNRGSLPWPRLATLNQRHHLPPQDDEDIKRPFLFLSLAARNHVNRMCLAADIPLIESGTAGYLGQVTVIKKVARPHRGPAIFNKSID